MSETRRDPRHAVTMQGRYRTGSGLPRDVVISDLSASGCQFVDHVHNLREGSIITIRVGSIGPITARVMWLRELAVGVRFESVIHASVLDHMLTSIDGWQPPAESSAPPPPPSPLKPERLLLAVRAATTADLRKSLEQAGLSLPITSEAALVDLFHHMLSLVAIEAEDGLNQSDRSTRP